MQPTSISAAKNALIPLADAELFMPATVRQFTDMRIRPPGTEFRTLPNGESRVYLAGGDAVILRGRANRPGFVPIGFGDCAGHIEPAPMWPRERDA